MAGVPYVFGNATTSIPLTNLDANFNTGLTIGNTTVGLGNTVTTLGNVTLTNVNIVSGTVPAPTSIANGTSNVSISSSGGNINVVTGGTIATFPQSTGTVMVSGNMPAFSAYQSTGQSITGNVFTKITIDTKEFDTATCFNTSTYRFTPTVAGYYQFNWMINMGSYVGRYTSGLYKNGSLIKNGVNGIGNGVNNAGSGGSVIINANGSTDYFEIYIQGNNTSSTTGGAQDVFFNGSLVRAS